MIGYSPFASSEYSVLDSAQYGAMRSFLAPAAGGGSVSMWFLSSEGM